MRRFASAMPKGIKPKGESVHSNRVSDCCATPLSWSRVSAIYKIAAHFCFPLRGDAVGGGDLYLDRAAEGVEVEG